MSLADIERISYEDISSRSEASIRRLLLWAIKNEACKERIEHECFANKDSMINALCWLGIVS